MIRPRIRPTVSRRNKYIGIAPRAEKKLDREARRASHDLRRLVGHANLLDVLVETLDPFNEDYVSVAALPSSHKNEWAAVKAAGKKAAEEPSDDEDDSSSDESWSDESLDDEHTLVRTASGVTLTDLNLVKATLKDTKAAIAESDDDYFSQRRHAEPVVTAEEDDAPLFSLFGQAKITSVTVTAVSPLSDLTDDTGDEWSPLASPETAESAAVQS